MGFAALLVGLVYLVLYGWRISWLGAAAAFGLSFLGVPVGVLLERILGTAMVQVVSVIAWPIAAVFMFYLLPS
jgi:hypothetical protein